MTPYDVLVWSCAFLFAGAVLAAVTLTILLTFAVGGSLYRFGLDMIRGDEETHE